MKRFILSVMVMLGLIATPLVAAAQPTLRDTSFESALSGDVIDLGTSGDITFLPENYDISEGRTVSEEYIWFTYGLSNFELVIVGGDVQVGEYYDITVDNMIEFYNVFEVVAEDITLDRAWFVANAEFQGTPMVVYYDYQLDALGDFDLLVMQFSPLDSLGTDMGFVQAEVTVGDQPLLPNANPDEIEALLNGDAPAGNTSATTPESGNGTDSGITERMGRLGDTATGDATAEATEEAGTTRATRTTRTTSTVEPTETAGTTSSTRTTRTTSATESTGPAAGDWENMGLVSDTEWVSPNFQTSLTWDGAAWAFPADYESAIVIDDQEPSDSILLQSVDGTGVAIVMIEDEGTLIPSEYADFWSSSMFTESGEQEIVVIEVAETRDSAAVVFETVSETGEPTVVVLTATLPGDGTVIITRVVSAPETASTVYGQFESGVQVNGAPLTLVYTSADIATLVGN